MTDSKSSTDSAGLGQILRPLIIATISSGLFVGAADLGEPVLVAFTCVFAITVARGLAGLFEMNGFPARPWLAAGGAAIFPIMVNSFEERGELYGVTVLILMLGAFALIGGWRSGALDSMARTFFINIYVGLPTSYLVLVGQHDRGLILIALLVLLIFGYRVGHLVSKVINTTRFPAMADSVLGGIALVGTITGGLASLLFLRETLPISALLVLVVLMTIFALVGEHVASILRPEAAHPNERHRSGFAADWTLLNQPLLLAAPAFFFAIKFYLT